LSYNKITGTHIEFTGNKKNFHKFKGVLHMWKCFKNEKLWCAIGGAAALVIGKKILTAETTRKLAVSGLAKGMKLQSDAKATFQNMKDEASDICCDAKEEAGLADIAEEAATEEETK
jgi:hypothetical protein